ncbi:MAG: pyridine nucleotide-disulfide oxidoreductase family protein [Frankiales bacterium]|nr:pyridine nucleotide-disulfide oxidoreductase family protein [Frankiales bacterium]
MTALPQHVSVAIIGSGFAGLGTAIALKRAGRNDFVVLERAQDVGGTWRDNSYPGCACDVPSHLYSFSFAPNPSWSRSFSPQPEIHAYLQRTAREFGVQPHLRLGAEVLSADWDGETQRWTVETVHGTLTADVVVVGAGPLSEPTTPDIKGLSSFEGTTFHSAQWDHSWSAAGRRVAVIGTGASAIQFVPHLQREVGALLLFQRTAPWVLPRFDRQITTAEQKLYARIPLLQRAVRTAIYWGRESHIIGFRFHPRLMRTAERLARRNLARHVADPVLREKLTPTFTLGCKRVLLSNTYYPALAQSNAAVVTDRIVEVVTNGIVTEAADGTRTTHEVDAIVFGTGFRATDPPVADRIHADGTSLKEHWSTGGMQALHGIAVSGFPNLFVLVGPNTGLGHNSIVLMIEAQVGHLVKVLEALEAGGFGAIEPRAEVQEAYNARLQQELRKTVWNRGGCQSWYLDGHGRNTTLWPTFTFTFMRQLARFTAADYLLHPRADRVV